MWELGRNVFWRVLRKCSQSSQGAPPVTTDPRHGPSVLCGSCYLTCRRVRMNNVSDAAECIHQFLQRDAEWNWCDVSSKFPNAVSAHFLLFAIVPCLVFVECYMEGDSSVVFPGAQWLRERFLCDVDGVHEGPLIASNVSHPRRARLLR